MFHETRSTMLNTLRITAARRRWDASGRAGWSRTKSMAAPWGSRASRRRLPGSAFPLQVTHVTTAARRGQVSPGRVIAMHAGPIRACAGRVRSEVVADITPLRGEGRTVGRITGTWGECLAEFFGTFVLIVLGDGVVAMAVAALPGSGRTSGPTVIFDAAGGWLLITFGWAMAVAFAIWVAGGVSGAHLNPAVTLAFAVRRKFAWAKVLPYWGAQILGAFVGAALVYGVYNAAINAFNLAAHTPKSGGQALATYSIFATFPAGYFHGGYGGPLLDQVVGTAFLVMLVVAVIDARDTAVGDNKGPPVIG